MSSVLIETPGTLRPLLRLSMPVLAEQVLHLLVQFTDWWLTGNLLHDSAYLAAMTLMVYLLWFVGNIFGFVAQGSTALTARFVGAGDFAMANRVMNQSVVAGTLWAVVLVGIGVPLAPVIVRLMGAEGDAARAASEYLTIEFFVLPAIMLERVGAACLRGAGDTVSGLVTMAVVNVVNIATSLALVQGVGPLPALGWRGVALGTAIGHVVGGVIVVSLLAGGRAGYRLRLAQMAPELSTIRRILRIGIPGGIDVMFVTTCHLLFLRVVARLGDLAAAAHGLAIQIEALAYLPGGAFQIAAGTLAGQYLGAGDIPRAKRSVMVACGAAGALMMAAGVVFYFYGTALAGFFVDDSQREVVALASHILRLLAFAMLPLALSMVLVGALRGAGDTRWPFLFSLVGMVLVRIPLAIYFAHDQIPVPGLQEPLQGLGLGVIGAWYAAIIDIYVRCGLAVARFLHGGWQRIEV